MLKLIQIIFLSLFLIACATQPQLGDDGYYLVEVTDGHFSDLYPGVWFAPSTVKMMGVERSRLSMPEEMQIDITPALFEIESSFLEAINGRRGFRLTPSQIAMMPEDQLKWLDKETNGKPALAFKIPKESLKTLPVTYIYVDNDKEYEMIVLSIDGLEMTFKWKEL